MSVGIRSASLVLASVGALAASALPALSATAATITGVYRHTATATCANQTAVCKVMLPLTPAAKALEIGSASCELHLSFFNFVQPPVGFLSMYLADQSGAAKTHMTPVMLGFRQNGSGTGGTVSGDWSYAANLVGTAYVPAATRPVVTVTLNDIFGANLSSGTLTCTVAGKLIAP